MNRFSLQLSKFPLASQKSDHLSFWVNIPKREEAHSPVQERTSILCARQTAAQSLSLSSGWAQTRCPEKAQYPRLVRTSMFSRSRPVCRAPLGMRRVFIPLIWSPGL